MKRMTAWIEKRRGRGGRHFGLELAASAVPTYPAFCTPTSKSKSSFYPRGRYPRIWRYTPFNKALLEGMSNRIWNWMIHL